jgi:hypothetical protein
MHGVIYQNTAAFFSPAVNRKSSLTNRNIEQNNHLSTTNNLYATYPAYLTVSRIVTSIKYTSRPFRTSSVTQFQNKLRNSLHETRICPHTDLHCTRQFMPEGYELILTACGQETDKLHKSTLAPLLCPRRNVPDFGRVFLMLKYTDITQNTYIQS